MTNLRSKKVGKIERLVQEDADSRAAKTGFNKEGEESRTRGISANRISEGDSCNGLLWPWHLSKKAGGERGEGGGHFKPRSQIMPWIHKRAQGGGYNVRSERGRDMTRVSGKTSEPSFRTGFAAQRQ